MPPGGQQGGLVHQIFQVRAGKAAGTPGQLLQVHILRQRLVPGVHPQDFLPALCIGGTYVDLPVEAARPQQGGVQNVLPVGGRQDHHALVGAESVHLHQELVEGLFPLVMAAAQAGAPLAPHGVDLVDEDNSRRLFFGLVKEIPHPAGAHAHIELHKVGARDGQEMDSRLSGHGLGQQGFTGARRAHQQNALGDAGPQIQKALGVPEKLHNLLELGLLLLGPRHVGEGHLLGLVLPAAGPGPAKAGGALHAAAPAAAVLAEEHAVPEQAEHHQNPNPGQEREPDRGPESGLIVIGQQSGVFLAHQQVVEVKIEHPEVGQLIGHLGAEAQILPQGEGDGGIGDHHLGDLLLF